MLSPCRLSIQLKHQQGFPISKSVLENSLLLNCFMLSSLFFLLFCYPYILLSFFLMVSVLSAVILSPCRLHKEAETVLQREILMTEQITRHTVWILTLRVYNVCVSLQTCKPIIWIINKQQNYIHTACVFFYTRNNNSYSSSSEIVTNEIWFYSQILGLVVLVSHLRSRQGIVDIQA